MSIEILRMMAPHLLESNTPACVESDGNCLYRAVSLFLFGSQEYHSYLRLITTIEIILNPDFYRVTSNSFPQLLKESPIFTPTYREILKATLTHGLDSDMIHLYALSAAIQLPINSFCPAGASSYPAGITHPYTTLVVGRHVGLPDQTDHAPLIHVMWTARHVPSAKEILQPTHLVCLIPSELKVSDSDSNESSDVNVTSVRIIRY